MRPLMDLERRAAAKVQRIVFSDAADPRIQNAANYLRSRGTIRPVLVPSIEEAAAALSEGRADGLVGGLCTETAAVSRYLLSSLPHTEDRIVATSVLVLPDGRQWVYADTALLQTPDDYGSELKMYDHLQRMASRTATEYGVTPVVALQGFKTDERTVQFDAAIDPRVAEIKGSFVRGDATVFIFRYLDTANAMYKATQLLGGAKHIGPVFQGFAYASSGLSRGATVEEIVNTAHFVAIQARKTTS